MRSRLAQLEPLAIFVLVYSSLLWIVAALSEVDAVAYHHWGFVAAIVATLTAIRVSADAANDMRDVLRPRFALKGALVGCTVVGSAALLLLLTGSSSHSYSGGFPFVIVMVLVLPAAIHEELVFRGVSLGALRAFGDHVALAVTALFFAALHVGNADISPRGLANIVLGGWLLGAMRLRWGIVASAAAHFAWNVMSGPLLGYHVSGWRVPETLLVAHPGPPAWWTGGVFGLEGGFAMTLVLLCFIAGMERIRPLPARDKMHALSVGDSPPNNPQEKELT